MHKLLLFRLALLLGTALPLLVIPARADDAKNGAAVGVCVSDKPLILRRSKPDAAWQFVKDKETIHSGDLILGGGGPVIESANRAVSVALTGDMSATSPFPVIETAVVLHPVKSADLDLTLERGAVVVTNRKDKGAATVRLRIANNDGEIVLEKPGDKAALEVYGRWLPGSRYSEKPKPGEGPVLGLAILLIKGEGEIKCKTKHFLMKSPPGPALLVAGNLNEDTALPQHLEKLPDWADEVESEREKAVKAGLTKLRTLAAAKSIGDALDEVAVSDDPAMRRLAVLAMGATDDLPRLGQTLRNTKHPDVWENGIQALRHWLGRGPGQDHKLYGMLTGAAKYPPHEAHIFIDLLHGFSDAQLEVPETYETLLDYLQSDRPAIRALAHWHLVRLVPAGKKIAYNPLGSKEERGQGYKEWTKLVPAGKVPGKAKAGQN
jgi:hypothetical protein